MAYAVESIAITDQNAQRTFGRRCGDMNRNLVDQSLATIGAQHSFNGDVVTGPGFGYVGAGTLQTRGPAVTDKVAPPTDGVGSAGS